MITTQKFRLLQSDGNFDIKLTEHIYTPFPFWTLNLPLALPPGLTVISAQEVFHNLNFANEANEYIHASRGNAPFCFYYLMIFPLSSPSGQT